MHELLGLIIAEQQRNLKSPFPIVSRDITILPSRGRQRSSSEYGKVENPLGTMRRLCGSCHSTCIQPCTSENKGLVWENMVVVELRRTMENMFYYKTKEGDEIDFAVGADSDIQLIQVCWELGNQDRTGQREIGALLVAMEELDRSQSWIITAYEEEEHQDKNAGRIIHIVPAYKWLLRDQYFIHTSPYRTLFQNLYLNLYNIWESREYTLLRNLQPPTYADQVIRPTSCQGSRSCVIKVQGYVCTYT